MNINLDGIDNKYLTPELIQDFKIAVEYQLMARAEDATLAYKILGVYKLMTRAEDATLAYKIRDVYKSSYSYLPVDCIFLTFIAALPLSNNNYLFIIDGTRTIENEWGDRMHTRILFDEYTYSLLDPLMTFIEEYNSPQPLIVIDKANTKLINSIISNTYFKPSHEYSSYLPDHYKHIGIYQVLAMDVEGLQRLYEN